MDLRELYASQIIISKLAKLASDDTYKLKPPSTYSSDDLISGGNRKIKGIIRNIELNIETALTTIRHRPRDHRDTFHSMAC